MSVAQRTLSYSLLGLITSTPIDLTTSSANGATPSLAYSLTQWEAESDDGSDEEDITPKDKKKGLLNDQGAWCWRDGCEGGSNTQASVDRDRQIYPIDCLHRTKAYQRVAETLQIVADSYDDHVCQ